MGANNSQYCNVNNDDFKLTRAVRPITCEATETYAQVAAHCINTMSKLAALLLPCLTLIHI